MIRFAKRMTGIAIPMTGNAIPMTRIAIPMTRIAIPMTRNAFPMIGIVNRMIGIAFPMTRFVKRMSKSAREVAACPPPMSSFDGARGTRGTAETVADRDLGYGRNYDTESAATGGVPIRALPKTDPSSCVRYQPQRV